MKATKITLTAATAAKIADSSVAGGCLIQTALTDLYLGSGSTLASDGATSFKFGSIATPVALPEIQGELWAISAAGGAVYLLQSS